MEENIRGFTFIRIVLLSLIGISLVFYLQALIAGWPEPKFDDSYMFYRYANNIANGKGFVWNPGEERVYGPTSILYVLFLAVIMKIFPLTAGNLLLSTSWILGFVSLVVIISACILSAGKDSLKSPITTAGVILPILIFQNTFLYHATTGMDTMFSLLSNSILILAVIKFSGKSGLSEIAVVSFCSYFTYLVRPDNGVYAVLFPVFFYLMVPEKGGWRSVRFHLGFLFLLFAFDLTLKKLFFGQVLPLSAHAKSLNFYEGYIGRTYWNPMSYLRDFFISFFPIFIVMILGFGGKNILLVAPFVLPVLITFSYYFTVLQIMGFECRYYCPSIPFLVVGAWRCFEQLIGSVQEYDSRGKILFRVLLLAILLFSWGMFNPEEWYSRNFLQERPFPIVKIGVKSSTRIPASDWWDVIKEMSLFSRQLPKGILFAASEIGYLSAAAPDLKFLDIAGLNDNHIANNGFSVDYVLQRKPEIIWFPPSDSTGVIYKFLSSGQFFGEYSYFPEAFNYGIAIRKSSPFSGAVKESLENFWQNKFPGTSLYDYQGFK